MSLFLLTPIVIAWNGTGHRVIAAIAYQHLTPAAKRAVNRLTKHRFIRISTWLDRIRYQGVTAFNQWHFINLPDKYRKHHHYRHHRVENVAWAVKQANQVLASRKATPYEKSLFLKMLVHLVGDAHQPLHCAGLYQGGNAYPIHSPLAANLHQLWDRGVGVFVYRGRRNPRSLQAIQGLAKQFERLYPPAYFNSRVNELNPYRWVKHGYQLAMHDAYTLSINGAPTARYIAKGQKIAEQQITLAGYRLARLLNQDFKLRRKNT